MPMSPNEKPSDTPFDLGLTRHWIAKCLVMGRKPDYIRGSLLAKGLPITVVDAEIKLAQESPYIKGGRTVYARDIKGRAVKETTKTTKTEKKITAVSRDKQIICSPLEDGDYLPLFTANGKNRKLVRQHPPHGEYDRRHADSDKRIQEMLERVALHFDRIGSPVRQQAAQTCHLHG